MEYIFCSAKILDAKINKGGVKGINAGIYNNPVHWFLQYFHAGKFEYERNNNYMKYINVQSERIASMFFWPC